MGSKLGERESWLAIAEQAALKAGSFLATAKKSSLKINISSRRDAKIKADQQAETIILRLLRKYTDFSILTEESGFLLGQAEHKEPNWIIDPLDGSLNFSRGIPICCISISLWRDSQPILGVIYDFNRHELFKGVVGGGAVLNGRRIHVSSVAKKSAAIMMTGFPVGADFSSQAILSFVNNLRVFKKVRLLGSAALSLAYVACGRADCYAENGIRIWDVAAGLALVKAAGGRIPG